MTYIYRCIFTFIYIFTYIRSYMHIYINVYIYIYIHLYVIKKSQASTLHHQRRRHIRSEDFPGERRDPPLLPAQGEIGTPHTVDLTTRGYRRALDTGILQGRRLRPTEGPWAYVPLCPTPRSVGTQSIKPPIPSTPVERRWHM